LLVSGHCFEWLVVSIVELFDFDWGGSSSEPWMRSLLNQDTHSAVAASTCAMSRQGPSWWMSSDL